MQILLLLLSPLIVLSNAQFYYHQPAVAGTVKYAAYQPQVASRSEYAHRSVVENAAIEAQLPPDLLKSDRFYKNPRIAAALAKESWFTDKEMPVVEREADKIPRDMVFKLFRNAGYIKRR